MTDFNALPTADLTAAFNTTFDKNVKVGSYTRGKMIAALEAQAKIEEVAQNPLPSFAKNLDAALTQSLVKKTKIDFEPGSNEQTAYPGPAEEAQGHPAMTYEQARAIVDGKQFRHPDYREARNVIHNWMMANDDGYRRSAARIDANMRQDFARAGLLAETEETEETEAEKIERLLDEGACPLCGGDPANQTAAGAEGTFLGDSCQVCHECGKTYSCLDGSEVDVPADKTPSKKRRILNPQNKINAKTEACAAEGIEVFYSKPTRLWMISDNQTGKILTSMDSRQFAQYSPAELVAYAKGFRK